MIAFLIMLLINPYVWYLQESPWFDVIRLLYGLASMWSITPVSWYPPIVSFGKWYFQFCTVTFFRVRTMLHDLLRDNSNRLILANLKNIFILVDILLVTWVVCVIILNFFAARLLDRFLNKLKSE